MELIGQSVGATVFAWHYDVHPLDVCQRGYVKKHKILYICTLKSFWVRAGN